MYTEYFKTGSIGAVGRAIVCTVPGASGMVYTVSGQRGERDGVHSLQAAGRVGWRTQHLSKEEHGKRYTLSLPLALHCACGDRLPADARPTAAWAGREGPAVQRGSSGAVHSSRKVREKSPGFVHFRSPDSAFDFKPFPKDRLSGS